MPRTVPSLEFYIERGMRFFKNGCNGGGGGGNEKFFLEIVGKPGIGGWFNNRRMRNV